MACTPAEWLRWLPQAMGTCAWQVAGSALTAELPQGRFSLSWQVTEPRRLGLAVIPRLLVRFAFDGVPEADRLSFMRRFDLYTQRGGG
jgi:hypothetical protein